MRVESRTPVKSKIELFVTTIEGWKLLKIVKKAPS